MIKKKKRGLATLVKSPTWEKMQGNRDPHWWKTMNAIGSLDPAIAGLRTCHRIHRHGLRRGRSRRQTFPGSRGWNPRDHHFPPPYHRSIGGLNGRRRQSRWRSHPSEMTGRCPCDPLPSIADSLRSAARLSSRYWSCAVCLWTGRCGRPGCWHSRTSSCCLCGDVRSGRRPCSGGPPSPGTHLLT